MMGNGKSCFFAGHSDAPESVYPALAEAVERHITGYGVAEFRVGNYGGFDRMAARAVKEAKQQHPGVTLYLVLPYLPEQGWPLPDMDGFDGFIYPEGMEEGPRRFAVSRLNRLMVQREDCIIAYVVHSWGGAFKTLERAGARERRGELTITNLGAKKRTSI